MTNILELARQAQMQQHAQQPEPTPTENAQIMCVFDVPINSVIYRFNSAKKGRKVYDDIVKAWRARQDYLRAVGTKKFTTNAFEIESDMFDGWIGLDRIAAINFVEWPKRGKFVPRIL